MPDLTNGPVSLHYQISGAGPALILIGGLGMPHQGWALQVKALSKDFRVIRFDNRGCGRSTTPEEPYTLQDMAGDVLAIMDHLELGAAHILGASMGGFIAMELALNFSDRVRSLVLAHTSPKIPALTRQRMILWQGLMEVGISDRLMAMEQLVWVFPEKAMEKEPAVKALLNNLMRGKHIQSRQGFKGQVNACSQFDITDHLEQIKMPVLLISSRDDISIPLDHTRKLEALAGFQKTKIFSYGGHATHLIHADAFNRAVSRFLAPLA